MNSFRDFLIKVLETLYVNNKACFNKFMIENPKIINTNYKELREPKQILDTDMFAETNYSANSIISNLKKAYEYFNLSAEELLLYVEIK